MKKNKILVAISAYNCEKQISKVLDSCLKIPFKVLVTDDKSSDNTLNIIKKYISKHKGKFLLIKHKENKGVGYVLREQINYAIKKKYDIIAVLAGNGKDDPLDVHKVIEPIIKKDYDYVQGSRFLKGGSYENLPFFRKILIKLYTFIVSLFFFGKKITDATNGFRAYQLKIFNDPRININQDWLDRYEFETYLQYKVYTLNYKITEVPVKKNYIKGLKKYSHIKPFIDWWRIFKPLLLLKFGFKN